MLLEIDPSCLGMTGSCQTLTMCPPPIPKGNSHQGDSHLDIQHSVLDVGYSKLPSHTSGRNLRGGARERLCENSYLRGHSCIIRGDSCLRRVDSSRIDTNSPRSHEFSRKEPRLRGFSHSLLSSSLKLRRTHPLPMPSPDGNPSIFESNSIRHGKPCRYKRTRSAKPRAIPD